MYEMIESFWQIFVYGFDEMIPVFHPQSFWENALRLKSVGSCGNGCF
jgi:hypothetical protein